MVRLRQAWIAASIVLGLGVFTACGSDEKDDKNTSTTTPAIAFAEVNSIIKTGCSGSSCHGTAQAGSSIYEDNETNFKAATTMVTRLNDTSAGSGMPRSPKTITAAQKKTLIDFFNQK